MAAGLAYQFLYPPSVMKRNTENALQHFADAVDTQDRAQVTAALDKLLTDDAKVHLEVTFSAISSANLRPMTQDFDKASFITFLDNILYTVTDYHYRPKLVEFTLGENTVANVQFTSTQWADGPSFYDGVSLMMHFSGDTQCTGEAVFENKQPKLRVANCSVLLRSVTKADSAGETVNRAQAIHDMLKER
jgi:hypothetical protein